MRRPAVDRLDLRSIIDLTELADDVSPFTLRALCTLGVADELGNGPRSVADLARALDAHAPSLWRALRAMVRKGIFAEPEPGLFELTAAGEFLRADHPLSMATALRLIPSEIAAWTALADGITSGTTPFELANGTDYWTHLAANPELARWFHRSQRDSTRLEALAVLRAFDWASAATIVDVGGGDGTFLATLLNRYRGLHGVVFDRPEAVATAPEVLADVRERCRVEAGSFFTAPIPAGADLYVLKRILYGWDDASATRILGAIRTAMRPDSRLLVIEPIALPGDELALRIDLMMLVLSSGRVRTEPELAELLRGAGLESSRVIPTRMYPILEVKPV
ncbi:methyltransferase [Nocardia iowensis]|uniref:Methyltransferase n=1 Tax=Nocardia iowensis TaxID=204891 RepID=A0ABX8RFR7_NOCIO|nr:methyltransferase [Nocardia iowensis]QXN88449.1 hypothetical protein KV110_22900 [Nocardia iowensis]